MLAHRFILWVKCRSVSILIVCIGDWVTNVGWEVHLHSLFNMVQIGFDCIYVFCLFVYAVGVFNYLILIDVLKKKIGLQMVLIIKEVTEEKMIITVGSSS